MGVVVEQMNSEVELISCVTEFLRGDGYRVRHEIPNLGQSADIVATKGRWITVIEAKMSDWGRGLSQCVAHSHVADFVCIAIATESISKSLNDRAVEHGIGIIHCPASTNMCHWARRPQRNDRVWRPERARFSRNLQKVEHVE